MYSNIIVVGQKPFYNFLSMLEYADVFKFLSFAVECIHMVATQTSFFQTRTTLYYCESLSKRFFFNLYMGLEISV